jgi:peptidoglycan hydrolase CwlO-like protein
MRIMRRVILTFILFLSLHLLCSSPQMAFADSSCPTSDPCGSLNSAFEKVTCYTNVVNVCSGERESMAAQVTYLSTRIQLTDAKIEGARQTITQLQSDIQDLTSKIDRLEDSLTKISSLFLDRVVAVYKRGEISYLSLLLTSNKFSDFISRVKYAQTVQAHDRRLLFQLQNSKVNYQDQKTLREKKKQELDAAQKQLEKEQATLEVQKKEKQLFLETTKNNESRYRQELSAARAEAEGIQHAASILSKAGVARHVSRGEVIGVMGNTGFSTGAHLHLAIYNLRESDLNKFNFDVGYESPFSSLVSRQMPFDPTSCDDVSPSQRTTKSIGNGSWDWPMANPNISQCYGHTPWSWRYQAGIHNGVDMYDDNNTLVKAVESGNAYFYRGGQSAGNGVFIFHDNGKMSLYWHLQ